jgi:hypothetical protein
MVDEAGSLSADPSVTTAAAPIPSNPTVLSEGHTDKSGPSGAVALVGLAAIIGMAGAQVVYACKAFLPAPSLPLDATAETMAVFNRLELMNNLIGLGLAGALIVATIGGGLWLLSGSSRAGLSAIAIGLLSGGLLGAIGGAISTLMFRHVSTKEFDEIFQTVLIHTPYWLCVSIALGLTISLSQRGVNKASVFGALLGAAIMANLLYPLASMGLFPAAHSDRVIPVETGSRLLVFVMGAVFLSIAIVRKVRFIQPSAPTTGE